MTEDEWLNLYENYETTWLLRAVDSIDTLRGHLGDGEHFEPPQIRTDLLKLHGLAMNVVNNRWEGQMKEMAALALDVEEELETMLEYLEGVKRVVSQLTTLLPENVFEDER